MNRNKRICTKANRGKRPCNSRGRTKRRHAQHHRKR